MATSQGCDDVPEALERRMLEIADLPLAERAGAAAAFCREYPEHEGPLRAILADVAQPQLQLQPQPQPQLPTGLHTATEVLQTDLSPGPRYAVEGEIAQGGMGVILKAQDRAIQRQLAMKVTRDQWQAGRRVSPEILRRFLKEARVTGQLEHPGVVPVHDLGVDEHGRVYFTMRLVRGRTADEVFELARTGEKGWRFERALEVLVKVCDTLSYAHSRGVVHRDLKPRNVMVGDFGEVYVMDWGLAKSQAPAEAEARQPIVDLDGLATDAALTLEGEVIGTPSYMPPEQAAGRLGDIGPRSDVYAVGAMLYSLLAGSPPYKAAGGHTSSAAVLAAVRAGPPQDLATLASQAPPELIAICAKAMQRDLANRYPDMAALGADLRAYLDGRVVRAFRTGTWAELASWVRRNKGLAASLAVAILAVLAGLVVVSLALREVQAERETARRKQYVANLGNVAAAIRDSEPDAALQWLDDCPEEHRGFEWAHLRLGADTSTSTTKLEIEDSLCVAVLDRQRIVVGRSCGVVEIRDLRRGSVVASLSGHRHWVHDVATTKDGRVVTASLDGTVRAWRADSAQCEQTLEHPRPVKAMAVAPDGKRVASAAEDSVVRIWSLATGRCELTLRGNEVHPFALAWFPDGSRIVTGSLAGTVAVWDAATGARLRSLPGPSDGIARVAVSPDGASVAAGTWGGRVQVWDLAGGSEPTTVYGHTSTVTDCLFTPDGAYLVTSAHDRTIRSWSRQAMGSPALHRGHRQPVMALDLLADGTGVVSIAGDATVRTWQLECEPASTLLVGHRQYTRRVAVSSDGRIAASGGGDQSVRVWDLTSASCVRLLSGHTDAIRSLVLLSEPSKRGPPRRLASSSNDKTTRLWDLATGRCLAVMQARAIATNRVAEIDECQALVTVDECGGIWLWDRTTGAQIACIDKSTGYSGPLSTVLGSRRLALAPRTGGPLVVWDLARRQKVATFDTELPRRTALAASPDGERLFLGLQSGRVVALASGSGQELASVAAHGTEVTDLTTSADGRRLVTISEYDHTLRLFTLESLDLLAVVPLGAGFKPRGVTVTPDGRSILVAGNVGVRLLRTEADLEALPALAARLAGARRARQAILHCQGDGIILPADLRSALAVAGLEPAVHAAALDILAVEGDDPNAWQQAAWVIGMLPGRPPEYYERALGAAATAAVRLAGNEEAALALGALQMRCGRGTEALATLEGLRRPISLHLEGRWLALVALSHLAAGNRGQAEKAAHRLRQMRSPPNGRNDYEANILAEDLEKRLGS